MRPLPILLVLLTPCLAPARGVERVQPAAAEAALRDCNANGVADEIDIAVGSSMDLDLNGVPDECEGRSRPTGPLGWRLSGSSPTFESVLPRLPAWRRDGPRPPPRQAP